MKTNLGLRFLLELGSLAAFGIWGAVTAPTWPLAILLAIAAPLVAATLWGLYISPKATRRLADPARLVVEVVFFAGAAGALAAAGWPWWGLGFAGVAAVHLVLMVVWGQRGW